MSNNEEQKKCMYVCRYGGWHVLGHWDAAQKHLLVKTLTIYYYKRNLVNLNVVLRKTPIIRLQMDFNQTWYTRRSCDVINRAKFHVDQCRVLKFSRGSNLVYPIEKQSCPSRCIALMCMQSLADGWGRTPQGPRQDLCEEDTGCQARLGPLTCGIEKTLVIISLPVV